jgi:hypothetical protein
VDLGTVDKETAARYPGAVEGMKLLKYDFVLVSELETAALRDQKSIEALGRLGLKVKIEDGLPIPELD